MKNRRLLSTATLILLVYSFLCPAQAHAYLDPGTGSYVLQLALAALLGALFAIRLFWGRIKSFFKQLFSKQARAEKDEP